MRIPLISQPKRTPLDTVEVHIKKIKECTWAFQQALECHHSKKCESYEDHKNDVVRLANEAHSLKDQILSQISGMKRSHVTMFLLLSYLKEQSRIVRAVESALEWISFRSGVLVPEIIEKDFFLLFDSVIDPIEELVKLVTEARKLLITPSSKQRALVLKIISGISNMESEANRVEERLKRKIFSSIDNTAELYHLVRLTEIIASISDQAENSADIMRAIVHV
ncbi:MAG: DUF47 family protein [Proteobacteria bacterium]|nr:DUF47 family protein [Pseudomonadota bacterium]